MKLTKEARDKMRGLARCQKDHGWFSQAGILALIDAADHAAEMRELLVFIWDRFVVDSDPYGDDMEEGEFQKLKDRFDQLIEKTKE